MVEDTTNGRGYEKPHPSNLLSQDVQRLRAGLDRIDQDMANALSQISGKAAAVHQHSIEQVTGLTAALNGKSATSHNHALSGLSDVSVTGGAAGNFLRYAAPGWTVAQITISDVSGLQSALSSLSGSIPATDDGTY